MAENESLNLMDILRLVDEINKKRLGSEFLGEEIQQDDFRGLSPSGVLGLTRKAEGVGLEPAVLDDIRSRLASPVFSDFRGGTPSPVLRTVDEVLLEILKRSMVDPTRRLFGPAELPTPQQKIR